MWYKAIVKKEFNLQTLYTDWPLTVRAGESVAVKKDRNWFLVRIGGRTIRQPPEWCREFLETRRTPEGNLIPA